MNNLIASAVAGAILMAILIVYIMRKYMIRAYKIEAPFDVVCEKIEEAILSVPGWVHPLSDWNFHGAVSKTHYFDNLVNKRIFFICKAEYANLIVDKYHKMGAMMPCAWAIYETRKGEVFLSKINIALMGKLFWGNLIGSTMGKVAREEHQMIKKLHELVKQS